MSVFFHFAIFVFVSSKQCIQSQYYGNTMYPSCFGSSLLAKFIGIHINVQLNMDQFLINDLPNLYIKEDYNGTQMELLGSNDYNSSNIRKYIPNIDGVSALLNRNNITSFKLEYYWNHLEPKTFLIFNRNTLYTWYLHSNSSINCVYSINNVNNSISFYSNMSDTTYISPASWDYQLICEPYTKLIPYPNTNSTLMNYKDSPNFMVWLWYNDEVNNLNSLGEYTESIQRGIRYAISDVYSSVNSINPNDYPTISDRMALNPNDFYVELTYLFVCLLDATSDCQSFESMNSNKPTRYISNKSMNSPYEMHIRIHSNENTLKYIHESLFHYDTFLTMINRRMNEDIGLPYFRVNEIAINDLSTSEWITVPYYISLSVYAFIGICLITAFIGTIHGFLIWKADCIRITGLLYFGIYVWDIYSDIVFSIDILNYRNDGLMYLFYISISFIILSWITNMYALWKYQSIWCKDETINERVYQWFLSWQRLTYTATAISGSAFGTIELANCYFFGWDFFCMGLNERHLKKFNNFRLYADILAGMTLHILFPYIYIVFEYI